MGLSLSTRRNSKVPQTAISTGPLLSRTRNSCVRVFGKSNRRTRAPSPSHEGFRLAPPKPENSCTNSKLCLTQVPGSPLSKLIILAHRVTASVGGWLSPTSLICRLCLRDCVYGWGSTNPKPKFRRLNTSPHPEPNCGCSDNKCCCCKGRPHALRQGREACSPGSGAAFIYGVFAKDWQS